MSDNTNIIDLKIETINKDIYGIGKRIKTNEEKIVGLSTKQEIFDVKFESLVDNLSEIPNTISELKEAILLIQNENKNIMTLIQNENKNIITRLENLESKSDKQDEYLKNYLKEEITKTNEQVVKVTAKIKELDEDGKFNIRKFIKDKWIYIITGGGLIVYFGQQIIDKLVK